MSKFGEHAGITCDGCGVKPIAGLRYKCQMCANHDFCELCYEEYDKGMLKQTTQSARVNPISKRTEDHKFQEYADKDFKGMGGGAPPAAKVKKQKPNDPCNCGSGKKAKKCCGAA
mmetsp:Transcript_39977/g.55568  ORF Transcript_39977/g.55568 Transcript_39977/m.55568 type:complete len:115 (+) Transcript_39977:300-644(+)|eukprot:CAMPEP_0196579784 /NCGR_PEP_ID=MMETSP1081-20130531/24727_1 /TAXON_ID=36882 /ORGANISM="Pyramimonas amylifera, Strain CCMP720" /LENGTH=114 /DNA_ID=CAMNT_0041899469 /DNA_START=300 /DNA_END=644 /DNA_ORIENTATION=-